MARAAKQVTGYKTALLRYELKCWKLYVASYGFSITSLILLMPETRIICEFYQCNWKNAGVYSSGTHYVLQLFDAGIMQI